MRFVPLVIACVAITCGLAGCATERLDPTAPAGVNLTGEWKFNPNLSDDPDKLGDADKTSQRVPGGHRGHGGRRGGGGMPPIGSPGGGGYNFLPVALTASGIEQPAPLPPTDSPNGSPNGLPTRSPPTAGSSTSRGAGINRMLRAPVHLSITQQDSTLVMRANMSDGSQAIDEYAAGKTTIPYGHDETAERNVGWRGPVFVVTTSMKKGDWREDDFALDDDGRLIMTTQTKGGRLGKLEIKRVYDRMRGAQS